VNKRIEVILFDLGGVLIELGESPIPSEWLLEGNNYKLSDWFSSQTAKAFEKGEITAQQFADTFKNELNIEASSEKIIECFTQWPIGVFPDAFELLENLRNKYKLAVLSNTNELHWPRIIGEFKIPKYFDHIYSSHLMHKAKPDIGAFQYVLDDLMVTPARVLFLDDNQSNVAAAEKLDIQSVHVKGIEEVRQALIRENIVDA
jgi:putative hydrolase of the HAD superfamily